MTIFIVIPYLLTSQHECAHMKWKLKLMPLQHLWQKFRIIIMWGRGSRQIIILPILARVGNIALIIWQLLNDRPGHYAFVSQLKAIGHVAKVICHMCH